MVDDEREGAGDDYEGPKRRTYTPPDEDAVYTGALPVIDEDPVSPVIPQTTPRAPTDPPVRTSLTDAEILSKFSSGQAGSTADMMAELEKQVALREEEEETFEMWANLTRATRGDQAETIIQRARVLFDGGTPEPEPETEPEPEPEELAEDTEGEDAAEAQEESWEPENSDEGVAGDDELAELIDGSGSVVGDEGAPKLEDEVSEPEPEREERVKPVPVEEEKEPTVPREASTSTAGLWAMWLATGTPAVALVAGTFAISRGFGFWDSVVAFASAGLVVALGVGSIARSAHRVEQDTVIASANTFGRYGVILPALVVTIIALASLATVSVFAGSLVGELVDSARWFELEGWVLHAIGAGVVLLAGSVLAILGGRVLQLGLIISSALGALGMIALLVYTILSVPLDSLEGWSASALDVVGLGSLALSGLLVLVVMGSADLTRVNPGSGRAPVGLVSAIAAVVPLVFTSAVAAALATGGPLRLPVLAGNPVLALAGDLPLWFPVPIILGLILPMVGLVAFVARHAANSLRGVVGVVPERAAPGIVAVLSAIAAGVVVVLGIPLAEFVPDVVLSLGVVLAAWAGAVAVDALFGRWTPSVSHAVRPAPLIGFVISIAVGLGLVSSSIDWLAWQGYLFPVLDMAGLVDISPAQPGVIVSLLLSAAVTAVATGATRTPAEERA